MKINNACVVRMSQSRFKDLFGPVFASLLKQIEETGTSGSFLQLSFFEPGDVVEDGDLVPQVHFSLQPAMPPIITQRMELDEEN